MERCAQVWLELVSRVQSSSECYRAGGRDDLAAVMASVWECMPLLGTLYFGAGDRVMLQTRQLYDKCIGLFPAAGRAAE